MECSVSDLVKRGHEQAADEVTYKDRLAYFMVVNFTGVPQSEEHKRHVMQLMETAQ